MTKSKMNAKMVNAIEKLSNECGAFECWFEITVSSPGFETCKLKLFCIEKGKTIGEMAFLNRMHTCVEVSRYSMPNNNTSMRLH
jgi:hypothetical protein